MVKKCKPHGLVILLDLEKCLYMLYRLFIAELFVVMKTGSNLHVLQ